MSRIVAAVSSFKLQSMAILRGPAPSAAPADSAVEVLGGRSRPATSTDIAAAIRFLVVLCAIGIIGAMKLAITSQTQQLAVQLDHARSEVARSEIRRERLLMERAMLRQPQRLQAAAQQLGLEAPVAVVDVTP